ncbi:hypothetical protein [Vibrio harveyi]|uniref:hypothetical protein n=1 Tax=Vibrio harveyi TaxID=669 RepID=UPI003CEABB6F
MSEFKSDTCSIQLINTQNRDIDILALLVNEDGSPMLGEKSLCFYNQSEVSDIKVRVGERTKACFARLTDNPMDYEKTDSELDRHVEAQLTWDGRYRVILAIAAFDYCPIEEQRFLEGWKGFIRVVHDGKELSRFNLADLGDLSKTGCIEIGMTSPLEKKPAIFGKGKANLPINPMIKLHANTIDWLSTHGLKGIFKGDNQ